jgi:hypothetical protein
VEINSANPIPIYTKPGQVFSGSSITTLNPVWIMGVFLIDFFMDILIVYGGVFVLYKFKLVKSNNLFDFSKRTFFLAILLIAIIGLITELVLGQLIIGLIFALIIIFISFILVSFYLLKLEIINSIRLALIAITINIIFWIVFFSI